MSRVVSITGDPVPSRNWYLPADPLAVRRVRGPVTLLCNERGLPAEVTDSVVLATDELATNAIRYGPFEVRLYEDPLPSASRMPVPTGPMPYGVTSPVPTRLA